MKRNKICQPASATYIYIVLLLTRGEENNIDNTAALKKYFCIHTFRQTFIV